MKSQTSAIALVLMACCCASGQIGPFHGSAPPPVAPATTQVPATYLPSPVVQGRFAAVKEYMRYRSPLSPIGDGTLAMMGDEAAFYVYSAMIAMPPLTPEQTLTVLDIIHNSFKEPYAIRDRESYNPRNSIELLKRLEATAVDQRVKERIATEMAFLTTLPKTITRPPFVEHPQPPGVSPPGVPPNVDEGPTGQ